MSAIFVRKIQIGSRTLEIHCFSGEVKKSQKWTTTQISGGGGSGYSHNGAGYSASMPVTSRTTTHDQIFVLAPSGEEQAVELSDVHLAAREGQWLTLIAAIRSGRKEGPYVAIMNHNTGSLDFVKKAVEASSGPMFYKAISIVCILAALLGLFFLDSRPFATLVMTGGGGGVMAWMILRYRQFKAEISALIPQLKASHGPQSVWPISPGKMEQVPR